MIKSQKEKALQMKTTITSLQSECNEIQEQVACVKNSPQSFTDNLLEVFEAKRNGNYLKKWITKVKT